MNDFDIVNKLRMYAEALHSTGGFNGYASAMSLAADEIVKLREYAEMMDKDMIATIEQRDELSADKARWMHMSDVTRYMWTATGLRPSEIEHGPVRFIRETDYDALRMRVKELEVELAKLQDKINPPRAHYERP